MTLFQLKVDSKDIFALLHRLVQWKTLKRAKNANNGKAEWTVVL